MNSPTSSNPAPDKPPPSDKWAPWWIYLIVLLGANYLRVYLMQESSLSEPLVAAFAVGQAALLALIITAVWRTSRRSAK